MHILSTIVVVIVLLGLFLKKSKVDKLKKNNASEEEIAHAEARLSKSRWGTFGWWLAFIGCLAGSAFIGFATGEPVIGLPLMIISCAYCIYRALKTAVF